MDLSEIRLQLDECDKELVKLYEKRMNLAEEVAKTKLESGKAVLDKDREKVKLASVAASVENKEFEGGAKEMFKLLMSMSRKLQYKKLLESGRHINIPFILYLSFLICHENHPLKSHRLLSLKNLLSLKKNYLC